MVCQKLSPVCLMNFTYLYRDIWALDSSFAINFWHHDLQSNDSNRVSNRVSNRILHIYIGTFWPLILPLQQMFGTMIFNHVIDQRPLITISPGTIFTTMLLARMGCGHVISENKFIGKHSITNFTLVSFVIFSFVA